VNQAMPFVVKKGLLEMDRVSLLATLKLNSFKLNPWGVTDISQ